MRTPQEQLRLAEEGTDKIRKLANTLPNPNEALIIALVQIGIHATVLLEDILECVRPTK